MRFASAPILNYSIHLRMKMRSACLIVLSLTALNFWPVAQAQNAGNTFWQRQSIYQIVTDRFSTATPQTTMPTTITIRPVIGAHPFMAEISKASKKNWITSNH